LWLQQLPSLHPVQPQVHAVSVIIFPPNSERIATPAHIFPCFSCC
jgi:hypothetical protein